MVQQLLRLFLVFSPLSWRAMLRLLTFGFWLSLRMKLRHTRSGYLYLLGSISRTWNEEVYLSQSQKCVWLWPVEKGTTLEFFWAACILFSAFRLGAFDLGQIQSIRSTLPTLNVLVGSSP